MATSTIRFGPGSTSEVGYDLANLGAKNVMLVTDANLATLAPVQTAVKSLQRAGVRFSVYTDVRVEPTDTSVKVRVACAHWHAQSLFMERCALPLQSLPPVLCVCVGSAGRHPDCQSWQLRRVPGCRRRLCHGHCQSSQLVLDVSAS